MPDPDWLKRHKELYGDPDQIVTPKYEPPKIGQNPRYDRLWEEAVRYEIDKLLAELTETHVYYTRRCVLPTWKPGDGLELG